MYDPSNPYESDTQHTNVRELEVIQTEELISDPIDEEEKEFRLPRGHVPTGYVDASSIKQASMDVHLPESNIGYQLLLKMGWKVGAGLGVSQQGRKDPIRIEIKADSLGVGKQEEEDYYHITSTSRRKALDSEKFAEETEEERKRREDKVQKQETLKKELNTIKAAFYCALCDKQYNRISEYEVHLSSYDHNHRKRFKEMKEINPRMQKAALEKAGIQTSSGESEKSSVEMKSAQNDEISRNKGGWTTTETSVKSGITKGGWTTATAFESDSKQGWTAVNATDSDIKGGWTTANSNSVASGPPAKERLENQSNAPSTQPVSDSGSRLTFGINRASTTNSSAEQSERPTLKFGLQRRR
ncbi:9527_t:CDS:2 [Paraglomus occultum]|uniref:9527_t:CDS:1 n=1 Tax=Paraglomus occultum TaxID=144539 RepID=A0A9N8Z9A0_9GLOM|nr:9527_t:CDS:2 [Paraglomus occultum]